MTKQEWIIKCNFLKNLLDSYGITVALMIEIPNFPETKISYVIKQIDDKFKDDFLDTGSADYHITLFPIMRSIFVLPEDNKRKELCLEIMHQLKENISDSLSEKEINVFNKLIKANDISVQKAEEILQEQWDKISIFTKNKILLPRGNINLEKCKFEISSDGFFIVLIEENIVANLDIDLIAQSLGITYTPKQVFHISLGCIKSVDGYEYLKNIIKNVQLVKLIIHIKSLGVVAYKHRSLGSIFKKYLIFFKEGDNDEYGKSRS
ncbi:MAG: hypothetical protein HY934_09145 [Candidatus Firestonebacteria bacterium]|nr:hypothetical protein [Candidatus Firestonebacteria bacterium]